MERSMDDDLDRQLAIARPLLKDFYEGWHAAVARYAEYNPAHRAEHDDTTAANCIRTHMFAEVVRRLDGKPCCTIRVIRGLKVVIWQGIQVWRFKKVDASGRHRNYPTQQQEDFDDEWPLPGLPSDAARLTSRYALDATGETIERIIASRVLGHDMLWAAQTELTGDEFSITDITPQRLPGTDAIDFDAASVRARRRRR
jgi:hypothetical protein